MIVNQKGFTLLELLVVLVIIALAASFSGPELWRTYVKADERSTVRAFADAITALRVEAFHTGRMIELPAIDEASQNAPDYFPVVPAGWKLEHSSALRMLPTGVTNGAEFYFSSPSNHHWSISLQPLDGRVEIKRL